MIEAAGYKAVYADEGVQVALHYRLFVHILCSGELERSVQRYANDIPFPERVPCYDCHVDWYTLPNRYRVLERKT